MKKIFLLLILISLTTYNFAQNVTVGPSAKPLLKSVIKNPVEGSPYFNTKYANGSIKTVSQKAFDIKNVRYNLETQQLEYTENENVYAIQDSVQSFTLLDSVGNSHQFIKLKTGQAEGFYEAVAEGNVSLLKQYSIKKEIVEDWFTKKKTNKLVQRTAYLTSKAGTIQKFTPSTKNITTVLADKKEQVATFIKNEQLDLKQDDDLIKVFKYYNTLQ
ncbi:hypothetical protein ASE74_00735 [Pedobacter sp. Leaf216]|uniref:hypothetical protein n=1 Tax=Pedobacter sp. Leaf216 TaxID=1735684 RepID=UPI0006F775B2|nr:hypothetical protein [Pedobacter sp. Leaf216]KQM79131.1 hypothetical protein ASE74_00735 [Pedobacter sp. Leaf216]